MFNLVLSIYFPHWAQKRGTKYRLFVKENTKPSLRRNKYNDEVYSRTFQWADFINLIKVEEPNCFNKKSWLKQIDSENYLPTTIKEKISNYLAERKNTV